ncbi:MAG TPA: hypothetical protein VES42_09500 [Pilimelia sp.]|nr:hypothetical protein [Pilimelia sp.]
MLLVVIVACEVGFWVMLAAGLFARYVLRRRRLGAALLVSVPLLDLILLAATVLDLRAGATANVTHGLAAAYLGFSVAFGHSMIRWADQRFAHRFAGGPPPWRPPKGGRARVRHEWREFGKVGVAWGISCALLGAAVLAVGDPARTAELSAWIVRLSVVLVIWFVAGPLWATVFPRRSAAEVAGAD